MTAHCTGSKNQGAPINKGSYHRLESEILAGSRHYQLVSFDEASGLLCAVYEDHRLSFVTSAEDTNALWRDSEYKAFRNQPYRPDWLASYLRSLRKKAIHRDLHPSRIDDHDKPSSPILPGVLLAPVVLPAILPFEFIHDSRQSAFEKTWVGIRLETKSDVVRRALGKPTGVYARAGSGYAVWTYQYRGDKGEFKSLGFENGELIWKQESYNPPFYGVELLKK